MGGQLPGGTYDESVGLENDLEKNSFEANRALWVNGLAMSSK